MNSSSMSFADDWPVEAEDPLEMALDQPFLPTHEALKACSGSDIHLVKGASNPSNRCLAVLPGLLALHPPKAPDSNSGSNDNPDNGTCEKDNATKPAATTKPETLPLGEMKGLLSTNTPTLRLGGLQLQGQRVRTSSKFLVLTIQPKKKRVICKHIFDSVVLFGQAQVTEMPLAAPETERPWVHYGGSARAGTNGTTVACRQPTRKEKQTKPLVEQVKQATTKVIGKPQNQEELDDDSASIHSALDNTKDEDEFQMDIVSSSLGRRASSGRKAKAPVKYLEREPDTESSDSDGGKPVKRGARANKTAVKSMDAEEDAVVLQRNSQPSSIRASRGKQKVPLITLPSDSSDSEDDYVPLKRAAPAKKTASDVEAENVVDVQPSSRPSSTRAPSQRQKTPPVPKPAKRVPRAKKTTDESSSDEDAVEVLPSSQPALTRVSRGKQKSPPINQSQKEKEDEVVVVGAHKSTRAPRKRNSPPVTQSQEYVGDAEASEVNDSNSDDRKNKQVSNKKLLSTKRQRVSAVATDSLASTAASPARRRRRTGTTPSPSKKPVATKFFQTSNDFSF